MDMDMASPVCYMTDESLERAAGPAPETMNAVVFRSVRRVAVERRAVPRVLHATDVVVKVNLTALCGSELHVFRGHQPSPTGFIMGHEFTGIVSEVGDDVKSVKKGDRIVCPFTVSCSECFYCINGLSSRCAKGLLFGSAALDGAQAEYVRVPLADGTIMKAPDGIKDEVLVLMADIFPTGYFAASNGLGKLTEKQREEATVVVIGCGPVGLCAVIAASTYKPKHLFAVDPVLSRLELARSLGAEPLDLKTGREHINTHIRNATDGRGADVVLEVVGRSDALRLAFDILRPGGFLSSVGVHNGEIPWSGNEAYGKNLRLQMGRCPVRSIFPPALEMLKENQHLLGFMADKVMPLTRAEEGYELFDKAQAQKVIFEAHK